MLLSVPGRRRTTRGLEARILLVDRQPLFLSALQRLLEDADRPFKLVATSSLDDAARLVAGREPDLVIAEARGSEELLRAAREAAVPVLVLLETLDAGGAAAAFQLGAAGVVRKDGPPDQFLRSVELILAGDRALEDSLADALFTIAAAGARAGSPQLSPVEREVLGLLARGHPVAEIAASRHVNAKTVRKQLAGAYKKLGARSRAEAVLKAARLGLGEAGEQEIPPPPLSS